MNDKLRGMNMNAENMGNSIYADNFVADREQREVEKYGARPPIPQMAAHPHVYTKHSIEPAYGQYDRPINESV
jgi:hypothetical protein